VGSEAERGVRGGRVRGLEGTVYGVDDDVDIPHLVHET